MNLSLSTIKYAKNNNLRKTLITSHSARTPGQPRISLNSTPFTRGTLWRASADLIPNCCLIPTRIVCFTHWYSGVQAFSFLYPMSFCFSKNR